MYILGARNIICKVHKICELNSKTEISNNINIHVAMKQPGHKLAFLHEF